jgi:hypothetical protein
MTFTKEVFASMSIVLFNHPLEEKKTLEYLRNLINSFFLNKRPFELFNFASDALGYDEIIHLLVKLHPDLGRVENIFRENANRNSLPHLVPHKTMVFLLKTSILTLTEERLQTLSTSRQCEIEKRFDVIKDTFKLTKEELEVLIFYYLFESGITRETFCNNRYLLDLAEFPMFMNYAYILFGLRRSDISPGFRRRQACKCTSLSENTWQYKHNRLVSAVSDGIGEEGIEP